MASKQKNIRLKGQILELADLVGYRNGSIVSREILKGKSGSATLFAFDRGQGLSEHTAPFDAMVTVLDGQARISISGRPFRVKEGEAIIMPANKPHALKAVRRFKMLLVMVKK